MTQISSRTCGAGRGSEARHALSLLVFVVVAILPVVAGATLEPNRSSDLSLPDRALLHYSLLHVAIAVAGWVVLLASVAWTFVSIRRETDAGSTGWRAQLSVAGVALAVGVGSALVLLAVSAPFSLHPDAIRDLLLARDCMERAVCSSGPAGFAGGIKGTTWVRLLAQVFEAGGVAELRSVVLVLFAASVAAVSIAGTRLAGPLAGGLAATAQLMWLVHHSARDLTLWNPTLVPAIASGVFLACALMIERGATRHVVWAGVWLGVAIDIHPTCLGLLPGYLLIAGITRHGSPLHLAAALLVPLATRAVISPHVLAWNVGYIAKVVGHVEVTALLVPVVVVAAMRRPWRRLPQRAVLTAGPLVWAGAFVAATAPVWASGRHVEPRYFECLVPLLAIALGVATVRLGRACGERFGAARACRWGCASVVAAALVFGLWPSQGRRCDQPPDEIRWELADMEAIGRHLSASGLSYRDVFPALRARDRVDLMQGLAPFMDRHPSGAPARSVDPMLVALVPASAVVSPTPESWSVVPLDGCAAAIVRNLPSTLDESRSEACYRFSDEPDPVSCFDQRPAEWFEDPGERFRYYDRVYPQPPRLAAPGSSATGDWDVRYRIPYATPDVAPAPRLVHIGSPRARNTTSACADACEWRVDSLGPPLEVSARCDEAPRSRRHHCASMPPVVETAPDESALRRSLGLDDDDARVIGSGEPSAEPR